MSERSATSLCLLWLVTGMACASSAPPNLYLLEPLDAEIAASADDGPHVAVEKVTLREYLDRDQIVDRDQLYQISLKDSERWAEPLDVGVASALAENLSLLIPSNSVTQHSWEGPGAPDLRLRVRLVQFGSDPRGDVTVSAVWSLTDGASRPRVFRRSEHRSTPADATFNARVRAMSESLAALSREIADAIRTTHADGGSRARP